MSRIPISNDRGLDPHMCICPRCGEENGDLTVGVLVKTEDEQGRAVYEQKGSTYKMNQKRMREGLPPLGGWKEVTNPEEKIPTSLCSSCEQELKTFREEVSKGGVHFICNQCHKTGVVKASSALSEAVRKSAGIEAPDPVGVEFEKCEEHGG